MRTAPLGRTLLGSLAAILATHSAFAGGWNLPPFDFSDAYYRANGVDPALIVGRPTGVPPNSTIDATPNGPDFNDVRLLQHTAAYDHSGHPIFFYVTGLAFPNTFTNDAAGREAREIADEYKVYEFPRQGNATYSVFPKRQDLIADLRHGYFGNDPLGLWQVNLVRYTAAATTTQPGIQALAELAARNGVDLDGTPVIRTVSEIEDLVDDGFARIDTPPVGGPDLRWFFCPVIEDPRDGAIAPDSHLEIVGFADGTPLPAEREIFDLFNCLRATGDDCNGSSAPTIAAFCFGTNAACPCANGGAAQAGCRNSNGAGGRLVAEGLARTSNDSIELRASGVTGATVLFFQGTDVVNGGVGAAFGDGLRCAGGTIVRIGLVQTVNGAAIYPGANDASVSTRGGVVGASTRVYQAWYRNAASFCTDATFNLTNAVRVGWIG